MESSEQTIFDDEPNLVQASSGKRFLNSVIDSISFYLFFIIVVGVIAVISPSVVASFVNLKEVPGADQLLGLVLFGLYMGMMEIITRGRTLGKLMTGTAAVVSETGVTPSVKQLFIRGIARCVPFEAFSALGNPCYPWHDRWSGTEVIDLKKSRR